jgi:adenylylsulfate kinase-like enzyme
LPLTLSQIDEHANEQKVLQVVTNMLKEKGVMHLAVEIEKPLARNKTPTLLLDDDRLRHDVDPLHL